MQIMILGTHGLGKLYPGGMQKFLGYTGGMQMKKTENLWSRTTNYLALKSKYQGGKLRQQKRHF